MGSYVICRDNQGNEELSISFWGLLLFFFLFAVFLVFLGIFIVIIGLTRVKMMYMFLAAITLLLSYILGFGNVAWISWSILICAATLIFRFVYIKDIDFGENWIN